MKKPIILCILDGWGVKNGNDYDAISVANTPVFDNLIETSPNSKIETFGIAVGLPKGQMGNSEVGHMNIGGGRVVLQTLPKVDKSIAEDTLKDTPDIQPQIKELKQDSKALHLMGLVSNGGVHAHIDHIIYLAKAYAKEGVNVNIHAFMDGRDTSPQSGLKFIKKMESEIAEYSNIKISTISGRYYAMDRDQRWDRVEKAYRAIVSADGEKFDDAHVAVEESYANEIYDEFMLPVANADYNGFEDGDGIFMTNFRADRAREILSALVSSNFDKFEKNKQIKISSAIGMVSYSGDLDKYLKVIFSSEDLKNTLGEVIADKGLNQLRISETEKYAHVTFFFNGGKEDPFKNEERILIPSPDVATYDLRPEMSASEVTENIERVIKEGNTDVIIVNYANPDMVGHSGVMNAAIKAVEAIDQCLGRLTKAVKDADGVMLITADHGNIEQMVDENGEPHTQHTVGFVPFIVFNSDKVTKVEDGSLCDISPTLLDIAGIEKPIEMNGKSLISV